MANRNSTTLILPGNPLGSVLRETAREARRSTRDPNAVVPASQTEFDALQAETDALQTLVTSQQALNDAQQAQIAALQTQNATQQTQINFLNSRIVTAVRVTAGTGIGIWTYPAPYINTPVVVASPIGGSPLFCVVFTPNNVNTQFVVWNAASVGQGGISVNLIAYSQDP